MAKKQKRVVKKKPLAGAAYGETQDDTPEQYETVVTAGKPRLLVTWHGPEGETRDDPKQWHGILFEQNKPTSVEHLPPHLWDSIRRDIDAGHGEWSYDYVVEHEAEPPPPEPEPETAARSAPPRFGPRR